MGVARSQQEQDTVGAKINNISIYRHCIMAVFSRELFQVAYRVTTENSVKTLSSFPNSLEVERVSKIQ